MEYFPLLQCIYPVHLVSMLSSIPAIDLVALRCTHLEQCWVPKAWNFGWGCMKITDLVLEVEGSRFYDVFLSHGAIVFGRIQGFIFVVKWSERMNVLQSGYFRKESDDWIVVNVRRWGKWGESVQWGKREVWRVNGLVRLVFWDDRMLERGVILEKEKMNGRYYKSEL